MIKRVMLKNCGQHKLIEWNPATINLIIGKNGSGKTMIMKSLYCAVKSLEDYRRGDDKRSLDNILSERLYWTFQVNSFNELIRKGSDDKLEFIMCDGYGKLSYSIDRDTTNYPQNKGGFFELLEFQEKNRNETSIFIPEKEVVSLIPAIRKTRENYRIFSFDDTYLDLVRALQQPEITNISNSNNDILNMADNIGNLFDGEIKYNYESEKWYFYKDGEEYSINVTSEGIKKMSVLNRLIKNGQISNGSIVFIDEIESSLHPAAISGILEIINKLSSLGIQFFIASHSYFVIKKLAIIAAREEKNISVITVDSKASTRYDDMIYGMPENDIVKESIELYKEELDVSFGG